MDLKNSSGGSVKYVVKEEEEEAQRYPLEFEKWYKVKCIGCGNEDVLFPHMSNANCLVQCPRCRKLISLERPLLQPFPVDDIPDEYQRSPDSCAHPVLVSSRYVRQVDPPHSTVQLQALVDHETKGKDIEGLIQGTYPKLRRKIEVQLQSWCVTREACAFAERHLLGRATDRISYVRVFDDHGNRSRPPGMWWRQKGPVLLSPDAGCCVIPVTLLALLPALIIFLCFSNTLQHTQSMVGGVAGGVSVHSLQVQPTTTFVNSATADGSRLTLELLMAGMFLFAASSGMFLLLTVGTDPGYVKGTSELTSRVSKPSGITPTTEATTKGDRRGDSRAEVAAPKDTEDKVVVVKGVEVVRKWCEFCDHLRPIRASHCHQCGLCVVGFDHHCNVIGACIGRNNLRFFILFVAATTAAGCCAESLVVMYLSRVVHQPTWAWTVWLAIVLCSFIGLALLGVTGLLISGVVNAARGITYKERVRRVFGSGSNSGSGGGEKEVNPFDEGVVANCKEACCPFSMSSGETPFSASVI